MSSKTKITGLLVGLAILTGCQTTVDQSNEKRAQIEEATHNAHVAGHREVEVPKSHKIEDEPFYKETITIGYNGGLCQLTAPIAAAKGFFEEAGLDVKIINVDNQIDAVGTGKVQLTTKHIAETLVPTVSGLDIYFTQGAITGCTNLYVANDSDYHSTQDLKHKKVGITNGYGGSRHNIGLRFFGNDGIKPEEVDYTVVDEGSSVLALENGEIQAVVLQDTFAQKFEDAGEIRQIRSQLDEDFAHEPCCVHYLNGTFVEENPLIAQKIGQVLAKSSQYIENHFEEVVQIGFDKGWLTGDFDTSLKLIQTYDWTVDDKDTQEALFTIANEYQEFGLLPEKINVDQEVSQLWVPLGHKQP
ncbi:ABC transporter substrate-binding protein [Hutsoniella sourekii]|uniref:ABC transporter substrate-binding protein n=1 Tax=Hutsoniella sourekii TaxID=87650 RepID=UPI0004AC7EE1|nr:ABC transporter substrate-binding protein [Hutsoniella sourekii]